jgi:hypothetical protein
MMRFAAAAVVLCLSSTLLAGPLLALDARDGVVLPPSEARKLLHQCSRESPGKVDADWTPAPIQIRDLEARLPEALTSALQRRAEIGRKALAAMPAAQRTVRERRAQLDYRPSSFVRQYAGFVIAGRRVIYVNALPKISVENPNLPPVFQEDWRHVADIVCDGGIAFFGVEYDPATRRFDHFAFNGSV